MTIKRKIQLILLGGWVFISLTGIFGLIGIRDSNNEIQAIYQENLTIIQKIGRVTELMRNNRIQLLLALQHDPANPEIVKQHDHELSIHTDLVLKNIEEIFSQSKKNAQYLKNALPGLDFSWFNLYYFEKKDKEVCILFKSKG